MAGSFGDVYQGTNIVSGARGGVTYIHVSRDVYITHELAAYPLPGEGELVYVSGGGGG